MFQAPDLGPSALPSKDPLRSFWLSEPSELADYRSPGPLPDCADIVIVGSGIAGALTSYNLLSRQPSLNITLVEAREICGGATGRNGGQIKTDPYIACKYTRSRGPRLTSDPGLKARVGAKKANDCLKFESRHLDLFKALLDKEHIECDFHITSAFDLCLNPRMAEVGKAAFNARKADWPDDMRDFLQIDDPDHLERLSQAKDASWGCVYKVGSVHPYKLVTGIFRRCFELAQEGGGNFNLQAHTPVLGLNYAEPSWEVKTQRGVIKTPQAVICTNGYVSNLLPEFTNKIIPLKGACSALAIPPVQPYSTPSNKRMRPFFTTYSLKFDVHDFDYMISRQEYPNHIVVGGGHQSLPDDEMMSLTYGVTDDTTQMWVSGQMTADTSPGTDAYFKALLPKHFVNYPEPESRLAHLWTGSEFTHSDDCLIPVMGYSHDGIPYCGPVLNKPKGLYMMGGFSGRGMV